MTESINTQSVLDKRRRALLLYHLAMVPEGKLKQSDANKKLTKAILADLAISIKEMRGVRDTLIGEGLIHLTSVNRSRWLAITEQGRQVLQDIKRFIPLKPVAGKVFDADARLREKQIALLLFQLLEAPAEGCTIAAAKKFWNIDSTVNTATARHLRGQLILDGHMIVHRTPRSEKFALTDSGRQHLAQILPALLYTVHGVNPPPPPPPSPPPPQLPTPEELVREIFAAYDTLRRELQTRLVPIHHVRAVIRQKYGAEAASHGTFDDVILSFRVSGQMNVISISDRSRATEDQLRDSIVSVGETFFYLEKA